MILGITGTDGAGEKAWDAFARPCQLFLSLRKNSDKAKTKWGFVLEGYQLRSSDHLYRICKIYSSSTERVCPIRD
jgi:hypothetical protein